MGKSRQGVYDAIKRSELTLDKMENSLEFFNKIYNINKNLKKILKLISDMEFEVYSSSNLNLQSKIRNIKKITESLIYETSP